MLLPTYKRLPVSFARGEGSYLFDQQGQSYLDAVSGVAVCNLGHAHPLIAETIARQASRLLHVSNLVQIPEQERLAEELLAISSLYSAFFGNSGSEANETAVKIARRWANRGQRANPNILCFKNAFHGRTMAMIAAAANPVHVQGFDPLPTGFVHSPSNDINSIEEIVEGDPSIAALMIEPIHGEAGVIIHSENFLHQLQEIAHRHGRLFILDEVQTGAGRTGTYFNFLQDDRLRPDIVTVAKGMANGIPMGVCLVSEDVSAVMNPGSHGSTFGGNPLACIVASKVIEILESDDLYNNARIVGQYILDELQKTIGDHQRITRIQGRGMMIGIEYAEPPPFDPALEVLNTNQILVNFTAGKTIRLLPPLILTREQADVIIDAIVQLVNRDHLYCD